MAGNEYDTLLAAPEGNTPEVKANEYDAQIQLNGDAQRQQLRQSILSTRGSNPDEAAKAQALSKQTGIPAPVVERNLNEVGQRVELDAFDGLPQNAPVTAGYLAQPDFARIATDQVPQLTDLEHLLKPPAPKPIVTSAEYSQMVQKAMKDNTIEADTARTLVSKQVQVNDTDQLIGASRPSGQKADLGTVVGGVFNALKTGSENVRQGLRAQFADAMGFSDMHQDAMEKYASSQFNASVNTPQFDSATGKLLYNGAAGLVQNAPVLAVAIATANPVLAAGLMAVQQQAPAYLKVEARGGTPGQAAAESGIEGAIAFATGLIPLAFLADKFGKIPTWQLFAGEQVRDQIAAQLQTHATDLTDTLIANPNATIKDYVESRGDAALNSAVSMLMQGVVLSTAHKAAAAAAGKNEAMLKAEQDAQMMSQLFKAAQANKVMERNPDSFEKFVQSSADAGGHGDIHVDAHTFAQAAGDNLAEIVQRSPAVAEQLDNAMKSGGDLVIPVGEYATRIAPLDSANKMLDHLRLGADAMSMDEARTFSQSQQDEFNAETQKAMEEKQFDTEFNRSADNVEKELLAQLSKANRWTDDANRVKAKFAAAYYKVQAAKLGITPEEYYVRYPLNTQAASVLGEKVMDQKTGAANAQRNVENTTDLTSPAARASELQRTVTGGHPAEGWAESTSIRRADDQPAPVYRGAATRLTAEHFQPESLGVASEHPSAGLGVWFTIDRAEAAGHGEVEGFNIDVRNPRVIRVEDLPGFESVQAAHAWREEQRAAGYDGLVISAAHLGGRTHVVAFDPGQVIQQPKVFSQETIENNTGIPDEKPPFYREVDRQVEANTKLQSAPAEQWIAFLKGLKGVKKEELEMSGVLDWLALGGEDAARNISKADVLNYLEQNGTKVETKILGEPEKMKTEVALRAPPEPAIRMPEGDYEFTENQNGTWTTITPDGDEIALQNNFAVAVEEARVHEALAELPEVPDEADVDTRAEELWADRDTNYAYDSAAESDWVQFNDPHLVTPNARVVELPRDLLRGEPKWGIEEIRYDTDGVKDVDEIDEPTYHLGRGGLSGEFDSKEAAETALKENDVDGEPWVPEGTEPHFIAEFSDHQEDTTNAYTTYHGAEIEAQRLQERYINKEVESMLENETFGDSNTGYWMDQARDDLQEYIDEDRSRAEQRARGAGEPHHRIPSPNVRHGTNYQSDGDNASYREMVLSVPNIEPFNATDSTHFQTDTKGKTIAWARFKIHEDANDTPTLFIEELQSQRAQAGREQGFIDPAAKAKAQAEYQRLGELFDRNRGELYTSTGEEYARLSSEQAGISDQMNALHDAKVGTVPLAPFVRDTQAWTTLTVKRLLRYMADNNIKQGSYTPGAEQVDRYTSALRQNVDKITWEKVEGGIQVNGYQNGNNQVSEKWSEGQLSAALGKAMAKDIIDDPNPSGVIEGDRIRVDNLWPSYYYGDEHGMNPDGKPSIVTTALNKVLKSLGGEGVKKLDMNVSEGGTFYTGVPGFELTPEMMDKIRGGMSMFQENRGQISFADTLAQGSTISLLEQADLSTYFHELGHFFLEVHADMAMQPDAPAEVQSDMQKLLGWFGVKDMQTWMEMPLEEKRVFHERFAQGFEKYLFEGKAPSQELSSVFSRIRAWMVNVYKQLQNLRVNLTDEVRGVMDRMLATSEQIIEAEAARKYEPLFKTAEEMGATPGEWQAYKDLTIAATQAAVSELERRSLRDMQWLDNARSGILKKMQAANEDKRNIEKADVTKEVRLQPEYAVQRFMRYGELPETEHTNAERKILDEASLLGTKMQLGDLKEMYGEGPAAPWRYLPAGKYGMVTKTDGIHPDLLAELFGFKSADEMIRKVLAAQPEENVIDGMTDQRMLEKYGDLTDPDKMQRAANEAIHNDMRARVLATELRVMEKGMNPRVDTGTTDKLGRKLTAAVLPKAAREFAEGMIARKKIRDVKPAQFEAAEARNAKEADRAAKLEDKFTAKRNQLVNNYAAKAAYQALDDVDSGVAYFKKFDSKGTIKNLDREYLDQIYAMLDRYDLRQMTPKEMNRRASLDSWIKEQEKNGFAPVIDDALRNETRRIPYKEMTVEEFRGMRDAIKNIEHLGRLKKKLIMLADKRDFEESVTAISGAINDNATKTLPEQRSTDRGVLVETKNLFDTFTAIHRKFASFMREMDGWKDNGLLQRTFVHEMNDRGAYEATENRKATVHLVDLLDPVSKHWGRKMTRRTDTVLDAGRSISLSPEERISFLLNMGNDINLERLMTGEKLTTDHLQRIVGSLTKADAAFVNHTWEYLDTFRKAIGEKEMRVNGVLPQWVEAQPFKLQLDSGELVDMRGGYYPIKYDPLLSEKANADSQADVYKQMTQGRYSRAQTRRGHLEERADSTGRALRYDFAQVITSHIAQVVHDLAWHEFMIDANRLMRAPQIESAIRDHYGVPVITELKDTLRDITVGPLNADKGAQFINYLRYGATISGIGLNIFNAVQNMTGVTQSFARVGSGWMLKGFAHWAGDAVTFQNSIQKIYDKEEAVGVEFMKARNTTLHRELDELRNKASGEDSKLTALYWYLNNKTQQMVDIPTWWGAYEKAYSMDNMTEKNAIQLAQQAVLDSQGGGQIKDLASIQRGGAGLKLLTTFYGFFNTTFNLTAEVYGRTNFKKPKDILLFATDMALLYTIPALMSTMIKTAMQSDWEDPKKLAKHIMSDQLNYIMGTVVGIREANAFAQLALGLSSQEYTGPAALRIFAALSTLGKLTGEHKFDAQFWEALNAVGGVLFHYPAPQLNKTARGIMEMQNGRTNNPGVLIAGPKPKK